jgi:hypothetical protein
MPMSNIKNAPLLQLAGLLGLASISVAGVFLFINWFFQREIEPYWIGSVMPIVLMFGLVAMLDKGVRRWQVRWLAPESTSRVKDFINPLRIRLLALVAMLIPVAVWMNSSSFY